MLRDTVVDFQNDPFFDHEEELYEIRKKYFMRTCLGIIYSLLLCVIGYYIGYKSNDCDGSL